MSSRDTCLTQEPEAPSGRNSCVRLTQQAQLSCPHRPQSSPKGLAQMSAEPFFVTLSGVRAQGDGACQCREERKASGSPCTCHQEVGLVVRSPDATQRLDVPLATRGVYLRIARKEVSQVTQRLVESVRHALTGRACTTRTPASPRTAVGVK